MKISPSVVDGLFFLGDAENKANGALKIEKKSLILHKIKPKLKL